MFQATAVAIVEHRNRFEAAEDRRLHAERVAVDDVVERPGDQAHAAFGSNLLSIDEVGIETRDEGARAEVLAGSTRRDADQMIRAERRAGREQAEREKSEGGGQRRRSITG